MRNNSGLFKKLLSRPVSTIRIIGTSPSSAKRPWIGYKRTKMLLLTKPAKRSHWFWFLFSRSPSNSESNSRWYLTELCLVGLLPTLEMYCRLIIPENLWGVCFLFIDSGLKLKETVLFEVVAPFWHLIFKKQHRSIVAWYFKHLIITSTLHKINNIIAETKDLWNLFLDIIILFLLVSCSVEQIKTLFKYFEINKYL